MAKVSSKPAREKETLDVNQSSFPEFTVLSSASRSSYGACWICSWWHWIGFQLRGYQMNKTYGGFVAKLFLTSSKSQNF